ncbi:SRPBCC family protein [candidate division KSB1 bacterium]|nr:SRPBCC family protein [candidate division KSB1 bacterium]
MLTLIHREFTVDLPLDAAWHHLAQIERWPSWAKHIKNVELVPAGELTASTRGKFHLANGIKSEFRMTELNPPHNWKWAGPFLWLRIEYDHCFEAIDRQRAKLTWIVRAEGVGVALFGRLFGMIYNRNLDRAIPNLIAEMNALKR